MVPTSVDVSQDLSYLLMERDVVTLMSATVVAGGASDDVKMFQDLSVAHALLDLNLTAARGFVRISMNARKEEIPVIQEKSVSTRWESTSVTPSIAHPDTIRIPTERTGAFVDRSNRSMILKRKWSDMRQMHRTTSLTTI